MIAQTLFIVGGLVVIGLGLAIAWFALMGALEPPAQPVTVPIEDPLRPHGR